MRIDTRITPARLLPALHRLFEVSASKILSVERTWASDRGTPVFTVRGRYTSRGWTEWTQGFRYGSAALQFEATDDTRFLDLARVGTVRHMASHVSHVGVHDHGFNNVSTYGNLLRLNHEGRIPSADSEREFYRLALKVSGAIQAARWSPIGGGGGFIHSFNGAHSLFIDTIRSLRSLAVSHALGHLLMGERDRRISLLRRLADHALATAAYSVYYGAGRDAYDVRGRTAHESLFNPADGSYRCPSTQQGYSPFSTWTRGLAWALCGFAEQLQFLDALGARAWEEGMATDDPSAAAEAPAWAVFRRRMLEAAEATADFYIQHSCRDGIPYWDTGAPNLHRLGDYTRAPSDPENRWEPVDSSAAAIAAQGFLRLGQWLQTRGEPERARRYRQAGLTVAATLLQEPYLSVDPRHQGLLLHSVYHRPNGWDFVPPRRHVPCGESSMWGDYHLRELAVMLLRQANGQPAQHFFDGAFPA